MVKIRKEEKRLCNGKLIVTDFRKLNPESFPSFTRKQLRKEFALFMPNGDLYINSRMDGFDLIYPVWEVLMQESRENLEKYQTIFSKRYPNLKSFDDWGPWAMAAAKEGENREIIESIALLVTPLELKRREIERSYYGES